jgi:hypothetical protein
LEASDHESRIAKLEKEFKKVDSAQRVISAQVEKLGRVVERHEREFAKREFIVRVAFGESLLFGRRSPSLTHRREDSVL